MKKRLKWIIPLIVIVCAIITVIVINIYQKNKREEHHKYTLKLEQEHATDELPDSYEVQKDEYGLSGPYEEAGYVIWDSIMFGNYYQSNDTQKEPIRWRVLSVDGDEAFLLSEKALDCQKYNNDLEDVTWETCSLRKWLNTKFYDEAFNDNEKEAIYSTKVKNRFYYEYGEPGKDTKDKVYLLSCIEHSDSRLGFEYDSVNRKMANACMPTEYAKKQGCRFDEYKEDFTNGEYGPNPKYGACSWWGRDPYGRNTEAYSYNYRSLMSDGVEVNESDIGVRPVINIDLSKNNWKKGEEVQAIIDNSYVD